MNEENKKSEAALREEKILEFWRENKTFEKSLEKESPEGEFVFYEGPPTANGKPGIHHLEARAFKDVMPRYKTMRGYHVRRKGGWDTHGLPVELQVEKQLGLSSKKMIEEYGVDKFNKECKKSVWQFLEYWNDFTKRIGYWVDQENPYVTYENSYIESLWSVVGRVAEQDLLYKDYKIVPWCPRCGTALSSHELAQGYKDVKDLSVTAKFKIQDEDNNFVLAWTTTPWTLPGNVALAVGEDIDYVKVEHEGEVLILAKERLSVFKEAPKIASEFKGKDLVGLKYEPLFPFFDQTITGDEKGKLENAYKIYAADFVTTEDGTGVVHTAVMYGQDDFELGTQIGLPKHHLVTLEGNFIPGTGFLEGKFVKDETTAVDIIKDLAHRGLLFSKEKYEHSYPHCWRCKTALIYYARDSWYIRMSTPEIKNKLIEENKTINWEPAHIRDGRFGEWLREIKDWAISRERYWGTPLPVWESADGERFIVDSIQTLKRHTKKSGNSYFVMRHGGTVSNETHTVSYSKEGNDGLTEKGLKQVANGAEELKKENIDLIITSPFARTRETAEIVRNDLGLGKDAVIEDSRLQEIHPGQFDGGSWIEYHDYMADHGPGWFDKKIPGGGESLAEVKVRSAEALYELEEKYKDKNILIVTHGGPAWLLFVTAGFDEPDNTQNAPKDLDAFHEEFRAFKNGEVRKLDFVPMPHDSEYNIDLHRPYIDDVVLEKDGKEFKRTLEVMDVWFDSGAMPFAQDHYPFENKDRVDGKGFPADFISEAIDQTRGWFYTLHAVGVLMGKGKAYKNVICLGHLLDAEGKKMSKSLGNIVDPWVMMDKYGVDTLRLWMYSVNQPGESKSFDEKTVQVLHQQVFDLLYNVLAFYELFRDESLEADELPASENILDQWILARLHELVTNTTNWMDEYKLLEPTRATKDFIGDLSTWYLRRSRERIKNGDQEAKRTLYFVLKNLVKLMAPSAPFAAEDIWQKLRKDSDSESVHLANWPAFAPVAEGDSEVDVIKDMQKVREMVSAALQIRQKSGLKVRQPLASVTIKEKLPTSDFEDIMKEELNVKEVKHNAGIESVELDTNITPELKEEGDFRELVRAVQDMRKKAGLKPEDEVVFAIETNKAGQALIEKFKDEFVKTVGAKSIEFAEGSGGDIKIGEFEFGVSIK